MKKAAIWIAAISILVFVIAWCIGGLMFYEGDYENSTWVYVGLVSIILFFCSLIYLKATRCPRCGRINQTSGAFCPYCGAKIK